MIDPCFDALENREIEAVESRLEELRTIERDRQEGNSRIYVETVAAQTRALPWRVTVKAFGQVLSRLGRTVKGLERDAAIIRQSNNLAGQLRSAKAERDSAVAEPEPLDADLRQTHQRLGRSLLWPSRQLKTPGLRRCQLGVKRVE